MKAMTPAQIEALNAAFDARRSELDDEQLAYDLINDVAHKAGLTMVFRRSDDASGTLFRNGEGRYCFGWTEGIETGFDDQIEGFEDVVEGEEG